MLSAQIPCVEIISLMALSELEQLEQSWMGLMQLEDSESVAGGIQVRVNTLCESQLGDCRRLMWSSRRKLNLH